MRNEGTLPPANRQEFPASPLIPLMKSVNSGLCIRVGREHARVLQHRKGWLFKSCQPNQNLLILVPHQHLLSVGVSPGYGNDTFTNGCSLMDSGSPRLSQHRSFIRL